MELKGAVQTYAWGRYGLESEVARLMKSGDESFLVDKSTPYAELWMGTHPKGPSMLTASLGTSLSDWIKQHPNSLGENFSKHFTTVGELPFLLKVLSVNVALSIQVHPDKKDAERLHKEFPDLYPDDNHKPEMAIALTPFEALCGFRLGPEIVQLLNGVPELCGLIGKERVELLSKQVTTGKQSEIESALKECFSALMNSPESSVTQALSSLVKRVSAEKQSGKKIDYCLGDLLLRLNDQFPGDVGCFCIYFLNLVNLDVGQALFLQANLPHAYLSGDCLECMACSDNVVRAGLTPKFKDVSTLLSMLNYGPMSADQVRFKPVTHPQDSHITVYDPPIRDFTVIKVQVSAGVDSYTVPSVNGAGIIIVIEGEANCRTSSNSQTLKLHRGTILFVAANESIVLSNVTKNLFLFKAYCAL